VSPSVLVAVCALSLAVALATWAALNGPDKEQRRSVANLKRGLTVVQREDAAAEAGDAPSRGLTVIARRLTPPGTVQRVNKLLARAGRPPGWPLDRVLTAKIVFPLIIASLGMLFVSSSGSTGMLAIVVVAAVVAYFVPELLLHSRGQERSQKIALELADTLDQMTIAVEAGLGFDSAMSRAGKNGTGPLAQELVRTLQDLQVGQSRRQAYEALAERTGVPDLRKFVRAIIQADMYGIAVADVLRTQADEMRLKRRQRAEEKAMQIPVKVIFPLLLFIMPVLFIVLLGPAVIDIVAAFS
jgi:tight adherence protein C